MMISNFLRTSSVAAGILAVLRIYLGYKWMTAGQGKITGGFDASGFLNGTIANETVAATYPTFYGFIENFALPNAGLFNVMIPYGEFLVGLGLILGILTNAAAFFAVMMNFSFIFAGTISSNPFMILLTVFILAAGHNAGSFGGDRWVIPYIKAKLFKNKGIDPGATAKVA